MRSEPGPGGLTNAMILAHRGFKVTVFEKAPEVGGRTGAIRLNDYAFDAGPTILMMAFILKEIFQEAGRQVENYLEFRKLDPIYRIKCGGIELRPTPGVEERISANVLCKHNGVDFPKPTPLTSKQNIEAS